VIFERLEMRGFRSYAEPIEVRFDGGLNVFMGRGPTGTHCSPRAKVNAGWRSSTGCPAASAGGSSAT